MKIFFVLTILTISLSHSVNAQQVSPELKRKVNDVYTRMEYYNKTTPPLQKKIDALLSGGNYYMSILDWNHAIKCYNQVLSISPRNREAFEKRNYCRSMTKRSAPKRRKSTLQRNYENGGL